MHRSSDVTGEKEMTRKPTTFGKLLRKTRIAKNYSLRKFAEQVGVSPTYLSQVEQEHVAPPTADRIKRMAEIIGENSDVWIGLAGRLPEDLPPIFWKKPAEISELLRAVSGLRSEQIAKVTGFIRKLSQEDGKPSRKPR